MSFVADELGVEVVPIRQLHREISPLYDTLSIDAPRAPDPAACGRTSCTRTRRRRARSGGSAALLAGDARPPIVVHTFHGHVLRGYFDPARTAALPRARAAPRDARRRGSSRSAREVRDDLVGLGVAPPEKFSVIRLGIDLDRRIAGGDGDGSELRRLFGVPGERVRRRLDRPHDGDQARAGRARRLRAACASAASTRGSASSATAPTASAVEERAHELGIARATLFLGYQRDVAPYYALFDTLAAPVGQRGDARRRDRGARRRHAGGRDARRRRHRRRRATASTACSCRSATSTRSPTRSSSLRATRRGAGAMGRAGRERVVAALPRRAADRRRRRALPRAARRRGAAAARAAYDRLVAERPDPAPGGPRRDRPRAPSRAAAWPA